MLHKLYFHYKRIFVALIAASLLVISFPFATQAAAVPSISIISVNPGESVTIQAENFPAGKVFNVRMDVIGKLGVDGTIVATTNTGAGSFEATYSIPAGLQTERLIAIRLDGYLGYFSYNWFDNKVATATPTPTPTTPGTKPYIIFTGVQKDSRVTVQANRFPANEVFTVRMGPFYSYASNHVDVATINSGNGGTFSFTLNLPASLKGVELVTVLLSGNHGSYAYNAFFNTTTGTVTPVDPPVNTNTCEIVSVSPASSVSLSPKADFDVVWTVKNTSSQTWDRGSFDYQYVSGSSMQRFKIYDFKQSVKPGETVKIIVDMVAPSTKGTYSTTWAIVKSTNTQCTLPVTVVVK